MESSASFESWLLNESNGRADIDGLDGYYINIPAMYRYTNKTKGPGPKGRHKQQPREQWVRRTKTMIKESSYIEVRGLDSHTAKGHTSLKKTY